MSINLRLSLFEFQIFFLIHLRRKRISSPRLHAFSFHLFRELSSLDILLIYALTEYVSIGNHWVASKDIEILLKLQQWEA